ncbi:MAG TPA: hypothetical protein VFA41_07630 [Ktedonobacteraceae bacterium]|jgi:hypothetical protein|nr:hypothetical protein [Ktedonobacteraceae bacterium]
MNQEHVPTLPMSINDLQALRAILQSYLALLPRMVPPSRKRDEEMALVRRLYLRMTGIPPQALEVRLNLTADEIQALGKALAGFCAFVRQKVPASSEREETLASLERLREHLLGMLR